LLFLQFQGLNAVKDATIESACTALI